MRKNIIEQLRHCATHFSCEGCVGGCVTGSNEPRTAFVLNDAADAIEELLAAVPRWISVEERLPRKYENVITADKHGHVQWNYLLNAKHNTWSTGYHITHWMPLPSAPKEKEVE